MPDSASKRLRRVSTESEDFAAADTKGSSGLSSSAAPTASSTRPRRGTASKPPPAAVINRSSPEDRRQSIHLTVKASPNALRKATSGSVAKTAVSSRNIVSGKRASRSSRVIREVDSDDDNEEDEEDEEPEAMDVDEEDEEDEDAEGEEDDELDAEGEEDDDMEDVTPAPRVVPTNNPRAKPTISVTKPQDAVEAKEIAMADDDDDEELSELDSEEDAEDEDAEGEDEDAEGEEDDELEGVNGEEDEDEEMDSDEDGTPGALDLSKLTRRQRAIHVDETDDGALMALSNEAQKKKHLTAEEHAMRRAEMARRRKNLSEKRNEEEKMDTINRLLKKQPPKRGRKSALEITESGQEDEVEAEKANPLYVRYIHNASGSRMAVPEEWLQAPIGDVFAGTLAKPSSQPYGRRMVEEVS